MAALPRPQPLEDTNIAGAAVRSLWLCLGACAIAAVLPSATRADTFYVSNWSSDTIERFTADGSGSTFYRGGSDLFRATGLAVDGAGHLYMATRYSAAVYKFSPDGMPTLFGVHNSLNYPRGMAFDRAGNLFLANSYSHQVVRFAPDGSGSVFSMYDGLNYPNDLAFDRAGNLYVANPGLHTIVKFTPNGQGSLFASNGLHGPVGVAFDAADNLYVANQNNDTIARFTPDGTGSIFASTGLNAPSGMAFDSAGNLYVVNTGNHTVQKFTPAGVGSVFASSGLNGPAFIAVQPDREPIDSDGDGVPDEADRCAGSPAGGVVNRNGCTIDQLVPCGGPAAGGRWRNHGEYVAAIAKAGEAFVAAGLLTAEEKDAVTRSAARSNCGKR